MIPGLKKVYETSFYIIKRRYLSEDSREDHNWVDRSGEGTLKRNKKLLDRPENLKQLEKTPMPVN